MRKAIVLVALILLLGAASAAEDAICSIAVDKESYEIGEKIEFKPKIEGIESYSIQYWIEDSLGNIVKSPKNSTNSNKKAFTPKEGGKFVIKMSVGSYCDSEHEVLVGGKNLEANNGTIALSISVKGAEKAKPKTDYSSKGESTAKEPESKAAALAVWFLLFLLTLFCIVLIWRR